ncbi:MAG: PQQ-binding-like beta-propeller repeat protein [Armatimonadota bacterium]
MKKKSLLIFAAVVVLAGGWMASQRFKAAPPKVAPSGPQKQSWWKYGGNVQNSYFGVGKDTKGKIAWTYHAPSRIFESPAIGADGTLYFQCMNAKAYALDSKTGKVKWGSNVNNLPFWQKIPHISSLSYGPCKGIITPAVGSNNMVYFPSIDGNLYALDSASGKRKWIFVEKKIPESVSSTICINMSSPTVTRDNKVVFCKNNNVYAVDGDTGKTVWMHKENWKQTDFGGVEGSIPAIGNDGTIYVGGAIALDPSNGKVKWRNIKSRPVSISIDNNHLYLYGANPDEGYIAAIDYKTGNEKWRFTPPVKRLRKPSELPENVLAGYGPAIGTDGTVYAGDGSNIYAINPANGKVKWTGRGLWQPREVSPIIASNDRLYLARDENIAVIDSRTGKLIKTIPLKASRVKAAVMGADGTIYVVCNDNMLIAVD